MGTSYSQGGSSWTRGKFFRHENNHWNNLPRELVDSPVLTGQHSGTSSLGHALSMILEVAFNLVFYESVIYHFNEINSLFFEQPASAVSQLPRTCWQLSMRQAHGLLPGFTCTRRLIPHDARRRKTRKHLVAYTLWCVLRP